MINASQMARMRQTAQKWMTDQVQIERRTRTQSTTTGHPEDAYAVVATVAGRFKPSTETRSEVAETPVGGREGVLSYWLFELPAGTDVRNADRLICKGRKYEVNGVITKTTEIMRYVLAVDSPL